MKKLITFILLLCVLAVPLLGAGCKVTTDPSGGSSVKPEENPNASIKLTVGTLGSQSEKDVMQEWINAYQRKNQNVSIKITKSIQGMADLISFRSGGDMPDIVWAGGDQHSPYSGPEGAYFQNLNNEDVFKGSTEFFSDFYESIIDTTHHSADDDGIWFVPRDYNRLVVYFNKTVFENAKVKLPTDNWTWKDFEAACEGLTKAGVKKAVEWRSWPPLFTTMLTNFGGNYFDQSGKVSLASAGTNAAFDYLADFLADYAIIGDGAIFKQYTGELNGSVPMIIDVAPQMSTYAAASYNGSWQLAVAPFPNFTQTDGSAGLTGAGCSGYGITPECGTGEDRDEAWKFLKWCMSEEGYNTVAYLGDIIPALKSMKDKGEWLNYTYYGTEIPGLKNFVAGNTKDIQLNSVNVLPTKYHDNVNKLFAKFWDCLGAKSYNAAIGEFNTDYNALVKV